MEQRIMGGLDGLKVNKTKQTTKQEQPRWAKLPCCLSPTSHVKEVKLSTAPTLCLRGREADWWAKFPPSLHCLLYLRAARTCVILMPSAFCNLTWEFKIVSQLCLCAVCGVLHLPQQGRKKKREEACRVLVSSRCQMHLTSYYKSGMSSSYWREEKRGHLAAIAPLPSDISGVWRAENQRLHHPGGSVYVRQRRPWISSRGR